MASHGRLFLFFELLLAVLPSSANAGGGPIGIDHRLSQSDTGIWSRSNQNSLQYLGILGNVGFALWEGGDSRLGKSAWQSVDSMVLSGGVANVAKPIFGRQRPAQTDDPNQWRKGGHSFPSGEVATITGIVTPYVLEYGHDYPAVWALELLPAYDGIARMKSRGHWQTDVLAAFAIGTGSGYLAHSRDNPLILGLLPGGFSLGFRKQF
jgi:undecaprenyl-diphosphatase